MLTELVGVDDKMIDTYDEALVEIYKKKYPVEEGPVPAIKFKGLKHIFMEKPSTLAGLKESWLKGVEMPHPVKTEIDNDVENCRKLMLAVGGASRKFIRQCITEQEEHAISLYRGQTRFMLEDLADVPAVKALSNKQKKKTAALVAEEMMSRNQGYSNLTELLLTNYVRLSIHAHDNSGPKFAVRLLPKTMVRPIQDLEKRHEPVAAYEFQLPTPWHNTIIKVEGDEYLYLARSEIAKKALAGTDYEGSWVEDAPEGAHFLLTRKPAALAKRPTLALVTKQGVNHVRQKVKAMRSPSTKTPVSPKPLSRTKTMPLFSPMSSEPVAWVTPVEKPAHPFTPLAERRVKTIFMAADEKAKNAPVPLGKRGRSATMSPAKPTASSSTGKINLMPLPDKLKLKFGDKPKAPEPTPEPRSAVEKPSVATVMEEEEPVTPPNEPANAPSAPTVAPAPTPAATQEPKTTPAAATPAAEDPKPSSPSEIQTVSPTPAAAQQQSTLAVPASPTSSATATANGTPVDTTAPKKRTSFLSFFAEKPVVTATVSEKQAEAETQSVRRTGFLRIQTSSRSPFATFMKRVGLVQSPA
jgi:pyoverdine/dityrosine biosynthesis protein Dit1